MALANAESSIKRTRGFYVVLFLFGCAVLCESSIIENMLEMFGDKLDLDFGDLYDDDDLVPEAKLDAIGIIRYYGYPSEVHNMVTSDGYILEMHRVTGGRFNKSQADRPPVLVMHGFVGSSGMWLLNGPKNSLGFVLADNGYDVWLGNLRGNRYTRRHTSISPDSEEFWNFSLDEHALEDLPTMIDYILQNTKRDQLTYVGHSLGACIPLLLLSNKLEYNKKLKPTVLMAPVTYTAFSKSGFRQIYVHQKILRQINSLLSGGTNEFFRFTDFSRDLINFACTNEYGYALFQSLASAASGYNEELFTDKLNAYYIHSTAGSTWHVVLHYRQFLDDKKIRKYNLGPEQNLRKYGQVEPPEYNFTQATAPIAIFWGYMDLTTDARDMKVLQSQLPNLITFEEVSNPNFSHIDFVTAKDATMHIYNRVIDVIKRNS